MTQPGILFDDLEPNATYQVRHWLFVAADLTSHHWDGRAGTLVVVQGRSGKPDAKRDKNDLKGALKSYAAPPPARSATPASTPCRRW